jgi:hypothetical protein
MASGLPPDTSAQIVQLAKECPLLTARRLRANGSIDLTIGTSPVRFAHGLGRRPEGYILVSLDRSAAIFRISDTAVSPPADPTREIVLQSSAANTVCRVLVY